MMLIKQILLAFSSLCVLSRTAAADLLSHKDLGLVKRALESTNLKELHRERTVRILRNLAVSETCDNETTALEELGLGLGYDIEDDSIDDYFTDVAAGIIDFSACDVNSEATKIDCDMEMLSEGFQGVCEAAGGQYFTITMNMSGKVEEQKTQIIFRNIGSCVGASCDVDEIIEEAKKEYDALKDDFESQGFTVTISGSNTRSTHFALAGAFIATLVFVFLN